MSGPRTDALLDPDHSWAVVDVQTSGFQPDTGRVLSVAALTLDPVGRPPPGAPHPESAAGPRRGHPRHPCGPRHRDSRADHHTRIVIAAALAGNRTFGDLGAVTLSVDSDLTTAATATLDPATTERTPLLAEIYRRGGGWRLRAVGQGYDEGLAGRATRHGVVVDDG